MESLTEEDPRSIGGYELRARLGRGGFGQVYLGLSPGGRAVAVKVLRPELGEDREFLRRFRLEVAAAQRVNGLYTAQVVAAGLNERRPWVATAFVPGPSLDRAVAANGPLPELALWRLLAGLVEALQAIHDCGLVHRDLKPENVMLAMDGPRVIDFGISKSIDGTAMTTTGVVIGTPSFMAPEQADGKMVSPETDVFSLGCVLAYAATGTPPFGGGSHAAVLYRVVHKDPVLDGVPPRLRAVIELCLAKAQEARPILTELAKIGRDGPAGASAQSPLAFWPSPIRQLIREYESQLDDVQDTPGPSPARSSLAVHSSLGYAPYSGMQPRSSGDGTAYPPWPPSGDDVQPVITPPRSPAPTTIPPPQGGGYGDPGGDGAPVRRRGGRWLPWASVGFAALAAIVVTAIMLNSGDDMSVPQVSGETQGQAVARIDAAGLKPALVQRVDPDVGSGLVISTNPADGSAVRKGQTVTVYLSAGPGVPVVHGLTWAQAEARIRAAGFVPVENKEASSVVQAGDVISTHPASGINVPVHGQVTVNVSTGPASLALPNVQGSPGTTTQAQLKKLGFTNVKLVPDPESVAPSGEVDRMTPVPGRYPPSQQITLYVSGGGVDVPDVVDQTADEATAILEQSGFRVQINTVAAPTDQMVEPGTVYDQNPGANIVEPANALIQIFVEPQQTATPTPSSTVGNGNGNNGGGGNGGLGGL
jgi:beta-lactam-binding protein with PASTA domain/serine/threonine protein kinase